MKNKEFTTALNKCRNTWKGRIPAVHKINEFWNDTENAAFAGNADAIRCMEAVSSFTPAQLDRWICLELAKELWAEFGDIPMDPDTECIEGEWAIDSQTSFPAGTDKEYIWYWFEEHFHVSIGNDLMGRESEFSWAQVEAEIKSTMLN